MASKHIRKLLDLTINEFSQKTFSKSLKTSSSHVRLLEASPTEGVSFSYQVAPGLCRTHQFQTISGTKSISMLSTSGALAVMDELSTYSFMVKDKFARSGVSIILSTEVLDVCQPGEEVRIVSKADKIGKTVGFCSMEMINQSGKVVARGKHIKYLSQGPVWDFIAHPKRLPTTIWILENIYSHFKHTSLGKRFFAAALGGRNKGEVKVIGGDETSNPTDFIEEKNRSIGSVFEGLGLVPSSSRPYLGPPLPLSLHSSLFQVDTQPGMNNIIGRLHGGAVAMCAEQAAHLSQFNSSSSSTSNHQPQSLSHPSPSQSQSPSYFVRSMEVRYLSAGEGRLLVSCDPDPPSRKTLGTVYRPLKRERGTEKHSDTSSASTSSSSSSSSSSSHFSKHTHSHSHTHTTPSASPSPSLSSSSSSSPSPDDMNIDHQSPSSSPSSSPSRSSHEISAQFVCEWSVLDHSILPSLSK